MERVFVLDRVPREHPDVSKEDAAAAWMNCVRSRLRVGKEPEEHVAVGYDSKGRLIELVVLRSASGDWLVKHAQTPPQEPIRRELGFERRKR